MRTKTLVTGPKGFVGARVMDALKCAVPAPSLRNVDEDGVKRLVDEVQPDLIIHTAAVSDIGACAKDPEGSYRANVLLPLWLARTGVKAVLFSSDQVYGGCKGEGPYTEDEAAPENLYAREKLEMEQRTLDANPASVLLRAAWMYDMPIYGVKNRGNFLMNMLRSPSLSFSSTEMRSVTYVREVAGLIAKAAELPGGVYNYGSENELSMLETAKWLANELNLSITLSDAGPRRNLWMDTAKLKRNGISFLSTVDELRLCISDYALKDR
ncbi:MAG: sugar nucleotide-binding protein [Clostridia bacterium]|nr:sugar nucleotide-binding protein [Clostridia bacterium]